MSENETSDVVVTLTHVDPRVVAVLRRAAELAAENGHWLGGEHLLAALAEGEPGARSLFAKWWPRAGGAEPDPLNGYDYDPREQLRAIDLTEWNTVARQMLPPTAPGAADAPTLDYTVTGPDSEAYRSLIEGPDPAVLGRARRYADYEPDAAE